MRAILVRLKEDNNQTLGELNVYNGYEKVFSCKTLELPDVMNIPFISCIPKGNYSVVPRISQKYKKHFHIIDVPERDHILIHIGNYKNQTQGCVLVGKDFAHINNDGDLDVTSSKLTLNKLLKAAPEGFTIEII